MKSPCAECGRRRKDKDDCSMDCRKRLEYVAGVSEDEGVRVIAMDGREIRRRPASVIPSGIGIPLRAARTGRPFVEGPIRIPEKESRKPLTLTPAGKPKRQGSGGPHKGWDAWEYAFLRKHYLVLELSQIADRLNRTESAVRQMACKLRLWKGGQGKRRAAA